MKTLTLLRHAKSSWDDPATRDFDRPLNARGHKAAKAIGRELRRLGLGFDAVVASPAVRVVETLADVTHAYGAPIDARIDRRIYLATPATLLEIVHEADDTAGRLLLLGHNPGFERLAMLLSGRDDSAPRAELAIKYPTATLAEIALPVERWRNVAPGEGTLTRFIRPRDLDPELGPDQD